MNLLDKMLLVWKNISFILPLFSIISFIFGVYKKKTLDTNFIKNRFFLNIFIIILCSWSNSSVFLIFVTSFLPLEVLYYYFEKFEPNTYKFDRIVITSLIIGTIWGVIIYLNRAELGLAFDIIAEKTALFYERILHIPKDNMIKNFSFLKNNIFAVVFNQILFGVFIIYIMLDFKDYKNWKISKEWIFFFVIPTIIIIFTKKEDIYLQNLKEIGTGIFTFFGVKTLYAFFERKIKNAKMANFLSLLILFMVIFNFLFFIIGVYGGLKKGKEEE